MNFADEVTLGTALSRIVNAPKPAVPEIELFRSGRTEDSSYY